MIFFRVFVCDQGRAAGLPFRVFDESGLEYGSNRIGRWWVDHSFAVKPQASLALRFGLILDN